MFRALLMSLIASAAFVSAAPQPQTFHQPLVFEPNRGQVEPQANWMARGSGYQLLFTSDGMTMTFEESASKSASSLRMKLVGGKPWSNVTGLEPTGGVSNYFRGKDAKNSLTAIPHYARISIAGVYDGVDLVFYNNGGGLEYDLVVHPGADSKQIQLAFEGQERMRLDDKTGDLVLTTASGGELRQAHPKVYQQLENRRVEIAAGYELLEHGRAAFKLGAYDRQRQLVIDPLVNFTTLLNQAQAYAVAVDRDGNSYFTGSAGEGFLVTNNSQHEHQRCDSGFMGFCAYPIEPDDIFVAKLSPAGDVLFSTYAGVGTGQGIAVDSTGVYVTGSTLDAEEDEGYYGGGGNLFVLKMSLTGSVLYNRVIAGAHDDTGTAIAVDSQHNAWVAGYTNSNTPKYDVLLAKVDPQGIGIHIQNFGGSNDDLAYGIAIDNADNPWVTGKTCSGDFPASPGFNNLRGRCGVFVLALTNQLPNATIKFASVFGGSDTGDAGTAIAVNANREPYITGFTSSLTFPVQTGAYQLYSSGPGVQAFVTKLDGLGHFVYSTLLGSDGDTKGQAIALNAAGEVYISGNTTSTNFPGNGPMSVNPTAGFVSKFSPDLSTLIFSRQIGDSSYGIATLEDVPAVTPTHIYAAGGQGINDSDHSYVDRLTDDEELSRLRNFWITDQYINIESGVPTSSSVAPNWWSAQWAFDLQPTTNGDPAGAKVFWIRNRWKSNQYLNIQAGKLQSTAIEPGWLSARWTFEPINGTNLYRIRNVWQPSQCLNIESGALTAGEVQADWWSSWWSFERVF